MCRDPRVYGSRRKRSGAFDSSSSTPANPSRIVLASSRITVRTTGGVLHVTDSNGLVAFEEPGLMGRAVFFHVRSHGYEFKKDGFGFRGARLTPVAGKSAVLEVARINIAERLYRVTGGGIYRDTLLLGGRAPIAEPLLNGGVLGQDSVQCVPYRGKLYWFWGDTNRAAYPLGNFAASGATSTPGPASAGIDLDYFVDEDGFSRPMVNIEGPGPKWIDGLMLLKDARGRERLVAKYVRVKTLSVMHERGLVIYDDAKERFERLVRFDLKDELYPRGHPILHDGYYYFGEPFPDVRVPARLDKVQDPRAYERIATDPGRDLRDIVGGKRVKPHGGSVFWNAFRKRFIAIVLEAGGTSNLGEIWYAESVKLTGPWTRARKIVTHDRYAFYNPKHHPYLDEQGGRVIHFEGTYTRTFSATRARTPRYDYNQIMYRLDLSSRQLRKVHSTQ